MSQGFKDVSVVRSGDYGGNRMVLRLFTRQGMVINTVAVPPDGHSYTGPTWAYLFEHEGVNLVDAGMMGSYNELVNGVECAGFKVKDIDRVIVTHGHHDHDGAVAQLVGEAGAEFWVHDIYHHLLPYDPREIQRRVISPIQGEMRRVAEANDATVRQAESRDVYAEARKGLEVNHRIQHQESLGSMTFLHAPGHSPDEICITLDGLVFTGDHVLPEISPHPTRKTVYPDEIKRALPEEYHDEDGWYGLGVYLRSLKTIVDLGDHVSVLPAHRLFNRDKFNFQTVRRADEIIRHHGERLGHILKRMGSEPSSLEDLTRGIFEHRKLLGGNLMAALSEVVAHVELLQDTGDLQVTEDLRLVGAGSDNYRQFIGELTIDNPA